MSSTGDPSGVTSLKVCITAQQAYPEFERLFLAAQSEIVMAFRIFDPWTPLYSDEARAIGETWFDLIAHTLARGVKIDISISDFDPVIRVELHRLTWRCLRALFAAGEVSGRPELLSARSAMHPARVGLLPRLIFWPRTVMEVAKTARRVNHKLKDKLDRFLFEVPFLRGQLSRAGQKVSARLFPVPMLVPVTHHQKLAVFDERYLYIGGLDLNKRRYDTPEHERAAEQTWHDVQVIVEGPAVADALEHLRSFEDVVANRRDVPALPHLVRTLSRKRSFELLSLSPKRCLAEINAAHLKAIDRAEKLIYLETQYFRDRRLAARLAQAARDNPDLRLILILPAAPDDVAFEQSSSGDARYGEYLQWRCVRKIRKAFGDRLFIGSPAQHRPSGRMDRSQTHGAPLIYLHAKVSIFDGNSAIVSSANLNGRSLYWDTETGVCLTAPDQISELRRACYDHWLPKGAEPRFFEDASAQQAWADLAAENTRRRPEDRKGFLVPYRETRARVFGRNIPVIPEEMV
jgi:phospholipase D1/2